MPSGTPTNRSSMCGSVFLSMVVLHGKTLSTSAKSYQVAQPSTFKALIKIEELEVLGGESLHGY